MRVLITGGTGLLGSRIARLLLERGAEVRIVYRPGDSTRAVDDLEVEHRPADILDSRRLALALEDIEIVFHTAALVSFDPARYEQQIRINVEGTRRVLSAAIRAGVRRFIHTSTVNTLGIPPGPAPGDEDTPYDWQRYRLGYMDSKRASERLVLDASRRDLDAVCLLPGTFFGPGDVNLNTGFYFRLISRLPVLVAPPGGTTAAHVDDIALGHLLALERGQRGHRYILGGHPVSYLELFSLIARLLGRPAPRWVLPVGPLIGLGRAASALARITRWPIPITEGLVVASCAPLYYSSGTAIRELGWSFRPLVEAMVDAIAWYRRHAPEVVGGCIGRARP